MGGKNKGKDGGGKGKGGGGFGGGFGGGKDKGYGGGKGFGGGKGKGKGKQPYDHGRCDFEPLCLTIVCVVNPKTFAFNYKIFGPMDYRTQTRNAIGVCACPVRLPFA